MENSKKGKLFVYAGASGVGKGTIMKELLKKDESIKLSVSATTRLPREGEVDGREYFFVTREKFEKMIAEDGFLEHAQYCDNYYGTPKAYVDEKLNEGYNVFLEIELQGAQNVLNMRPDAVSIFILPPSVEELERRLRDRGTETEEAILKRLSQAKVEMDHAKMYKYTVVNDDLQKAVEDVLEIVNKETK
ncbi:MAG: guanylate kinase [Ruminococcus sp.]|nr:guanylate kinase [Ruminococcus sp.]MDO4420213.1 guanylate kinase [Ruminococcus sp.]